MSDFPNLFPANAGNVAGGNEVTIENGYATVNAVDYPIVSLNLYGKSVQDGTPTPETPVDIVSVGDDGAVVITVDNGGDTTLSAEITSGLPLYSIGDVRDELIYNVDGTGKIIKRVTTNNIANYEYFFIVNYSEANSFVQFNYTASPNRKTGIGLSSHFTYSTNNVGFHYVSNTLVVIIDKQILNKYDPNAVDSASYRTAFVNWCKENSPVFLLALATPQEIELSAAEMAELMQLQTFDGVTNIYNDEDAEMKVKIATNPLLSEYVKPVIDGITARYEARIAALEAAITSNN